MERAVVMVHKLTDAEVERLCCRQDFIKQEAAAEDREQGDGQSSGSQLEVIYVKSEVPDAELEAVTVKDEPIDWHQEPQASSSSGSHAVTFKREVDNDCTEARTGHAEAEDKLREGSSGACGTSAVHQGRAGPSQGSTASPPSYVSCSGSGVAAAPPDRLTSRPLLCEHCDYSTGRRDLMELHLRVRHKLGCYYECALCDFATMYMITLERHVVARHLNENQYEGLYGRYQYSDVKMMGKQRCGKHGKKALKCNLCGFLSLIDFSSDTHDKGILDNNIVYKCAVCEYFLANETNLKRSLSCKRKIECKISKPGQRQFYIRKLKDYSHAFKTEPEAQQTIKHVKGHLFKCKLCDFSSAYKCSVKSHLASKHGKGQLFRCEICNFSSARKDRLEQHRASKHEKIDQLLKCEMCEFSSARKDRFKQHLASNHGQGQLFKCKMCDFFCARKDNVKAHLARKHGYTDSFPFWQ